MKRFCGNDLPIDLLFTIFVTLPVKSLLRLRCVCKTWRDLIHNPTFISMHSDIARRNDTMFLIHKNSHYKHSLIKDFIKLNKNNLSCSIEEDGQGTIDLSLGHECELLDLSNKFHPGPSYMLEFHGSCNGLVCLSITKPSPFEIFHIPELFLWNPSIKKLKSLGYNSSRDIFKVHHTGFGLCKSHIDDYKVVQFSFCNVLTNEKSTVLDVYTLSTNSWKRSDVFVETIIAGNWNSSKSVNGALHWVGTKPNKENVIVSFDLQSEVLGEILLPKSNSELMFGPKWYLGNTGGVLSLLSCDSSLSTIVLWVMKEYGVVESWTEYSITGGRPCYLPIWFGYEGFMLYVSGMDGISMFDFKELMWKHIVENKDDRRPPTYCVIDYNESLVLLNETM